MKNKITLYSLIIIALLSGCTKNFEDVPIDYTSSNAVYAFDVTDPQGIEAEQYLNSIYATMPLGYNRIGGGMTGNTFAVNDIVNGLTTCPLDASTDDAISTYPGNSVDNLSLNGYTPTNNPDDSWSNSYAGIRKANIFLANYQKVPWSVTGKIQWYGAETRFLRAFFYFELVKRYGGVPLLNNTILSLSDNLDLPRNSYDECITYIINELDDIKDKLRSDPLSATDIGHISQGAAYALKAKVLLYAASPLNNSSNDLTKWKAAADAAFAVMNLNKFQLESNVNNAFTTLGSKEDVFYRMNGVNNSGTSYTTQTNQLEYALSPVGYNVANTFAQGRVSPSQELVDAFGMANGKAITDPTSGYDSNAPYQNRDPRLALTVFYNGQTWLNRAVETFIGGKDNSGTIKTRTGYYERKFLGNYQTGSSFSNVYRPWPYIRYAEVLLDFAESRNEFSGPDADIYNALKLLRIRAGISANSDNLYGLPASATQDQMRSIIRNERRIELAFEEQHYWDLRRWKTAEAAYANGVSGMNITKNPNGTYSYARAIVQQPFFQSRMYLYPIPYSQIVISTNLKQNAGW